MEDRIAIITGAGSGIGLASAHALLAAGWRIAAVDRDEDGLQRCARQAATNRLTIHPLDLTDEAAIEALSADLTGQPVRALVNCAGAGANTRFCDSSTDQFRRIYEINVVGAFAISKAFVPVIEAAGGGAIVNVSSVSGIRGNLGRSAYGASKGALNTLTRIMAVELADRSIRVNAIAPGPIETPMVQEVHTEETRRQWGQTVPLRRYGTAQEVAEAVRFLIDPAAASYVTGQILAVDGGFTAAGLMAAQ